MIEVQRNNITEICLAVLLYSYQRLITSDVFVSFYDPQNLIMLLTSLADTKHKICGFDVQKKLYATILHFPQHKNLYHRKS